MFTKQLLKDFWQTKRHIHSSVLGTSGWNLHQFDGEKSAGQQVFIYVYDMPSEFIWMASLPRADFITNSVLANKNTKQHQDFRNGVSILLFDIVSGKLPASIDGVDWENQLGILLTAYAGTTRTWELANKMQDGGHFIVLNYRASIASKDSKLRPFAIPDTNNSVLTVENLQSSIHQVIQIDKENHPEWFGLADYAK